MQAMMLHDFPGNVRELENIIERGVILCRGNSLTISDLALDNEQAAFLSDADRDVLHLSFKEAKDKMIHLFHRHYIQTLLSQSAGNISRAAQTAGIQRQYLHRLMKETGIDADDFRL
jgi:DNA-binding NtrC family response regulator